MRVAFFLRICSKPVSDLLVMRLGSSRTRATVKRYAVMKENTLTKRGLAMQDSKEKDWRRERAMRQSGINR